jgi:hypothetical protein
LLQLDSPERRRLFFAAVTLCAVSVTLLPLSGRSAFVPSDMSLKGIRGFRALESLPAIPQPQMRFERNPFEQPQPAVPTVRAAGKNLVVRALVVGDDPEAIVDDHGVVKIVAIGDTLAGWSVKAIDERGVHLSNGVVLTDGDPR